MKRVWSLPALLLVFLFVGGAPCPGAAECESNSDCDGREDFCVDGECVECEDDNDCDAGETCEDNECEGGAGEGEGEGEGEVPSALIAQICTQFVSCGLQSDFDACVAEGTSFFTSIAPGPQCDQLRAALIEFYGCAAVQDCSFFETGPVEGGPCFAEFNVVNQLQTEVGDQCLNGGEGEGEPPPSSCRDFLGAGDGCDCGCFETDPDCLGASCTEPGCFAEGCDTCWADVSTPERCG